MVLSRAIYLFISRKFDCFYFLLLNQQSTEMSSPSEMDLSEERETRPGFVQSVWKALSGSRLPTSEERKRNSPTFEEQDAGMTNREMMSVGPTGFLKKSDVLETDSARVGDVHPRDSPLTFYSDRQLGIDLESNAGRKAGISFAERSRAFPSPPHQPVGFVSEREYVSLDPARQSNVGGTAPSSEQARTHSLRRPNEPSSNNGVSPLGQGDV